MIGSYSCSPASQRKNLMRNPSAKHALEIPGQVAPAISWVATWSTAKNDKNEIEWGYTLSVAWDFAASQRDAFYWIQSVQRQKRTQSGWPSDLGFGGFWRVLDSFLQFEHQLGHHIQGNTQTQELNLRNIYPLNSIQLLSVTRWHFASFVDPRWPTSSY